MNKFFFTAGQTIRMQRQINNFSVDIFAKKLVKEHGFLSYVFCVVVVEANYGHSRCQMSIICSVGDWQVIQLRDGWRISQLGTFFDIIVAICWFLCSYGILMPQKQKEIL